MKSLIPLAVLLCSLVIACGGGDDEDADFDPLSYDVRRLTKMVADQLGPEAGFDAIIFAYERGYSPAQVFQAIEDAWLRPDGRVQSEDGSKGLTPAGEPLGLIQLPDSAWTGRNSVKLIGWPMQEPKPAAPLIDVGFLRGQAAAEAEYLNSQGRVFVERGPSLGYIGLSLVIRYSLSGYTPDQIVEALISGTREDEIVTEHRMMVSDHCVFLRDEHGRIILPQGDYREYGCTGDIEFLAKQEAQSGGSQSEDAPEKKDDKEESKAAQPADNDDRVGFYGGTLTLVQCGVTCDLLQCEIVRPFRLAVNADGSIRGSTPAQSRWTRTECLEPLEGGWSVEGEWTEDGLVHAELGSFVDEFASIRGEVGDGMLIVSLDNDPRAGKAGSILQFEAVLTKE